MHEQPLQLDEQLSAVLDGEASELELRRFLQRLDELSDAERSALYGRWDRYQRISAGLAGDAPAALAGGGFVDKVTNQLDDEQPVLVPAMASDYAGSGPSRSPSVWSKMAVAASVALAVTVGVQQLHINSQSEQLRVAMNAEVNAGAAQSVETTTLPSGQIPIPRQGVQVASAITGSTPTAKNTAAIDEQEFQRRLQDYLMQHANHAAQQNGQGIVPFARTAGFDAE